MTGPDHYRAAEDCLAESAEWDDPQACIDLIAKAQVHATLAQAAATVDAAPTDVDDYPNWMRAFKGEAPMPRRF